MSQSDQDGLLTRFTRQLNLFQTPQKVKAKIKDKIIRDERDSKDRKLGFEHDKVDVISSLPNDILCRIISFLPFESAVQTSFLSNRWKNLWKMALVKDGSKEEAVSSVLNFVNDFPHQLHQPRKNWGMQYNFKYRGRTVSFKYYNEDPLYYLNSPGTGSTDSHLELEDAMLDFRQGPGYYGIHLPGFRLILKSIRRVKTLTLCRWVFEALILPELYHLREGFYKLTELWWIDNLQDRYDSSALITFLKLCPQLIRLYITIDPNSYNTTDISMYSSKVTRPTKLKHLKVVKLEGFGNEERVIELAKQLKEEFKAEPVIVKQDGTVRQLMKVHEEQQEGTNPYEFVEKRIENLHELCPKHVHMNL